MTSVWGVAIVWSGVPVRTKRLGSTGSTMTLNTPLKPAPASVMARFSLLTTPWRPAVVTWVTGAAVSATEPAVAVAGALSVMLAFSLMAVM